MVLKMIARMMKKAIKMITLMIKKWKMVIKVLSKADEKESEMKMRILYEIKREKKLFVE